MNSRPKKYPGEAPAKGDGVKAIIFDCWGTLVEQGVRSPLKQAKYLMGLQMPFTEYVNRMERAMMTREFPSLGDAFRAVCEEFQVPFPKERREELVGELVGMWNKSWMLAAPYDDAMQTLERLRGHTLILVSNTDCFSIERVLEKFKLKEFFSHHFFSYKLGSLKTDPEFLAQVLRETGFAPGECLLAGDSIQSDVLPAKAAGIKAVLIDRRNTREFSPKISSLQELEKHL